MTQEILSHLASAYPLSEEDAGEFAKLRVNGMELAVRVFRAEGLGHVSLMSGGVPGVFSTDTLIVNPFERDAALLSYDRIQAADNDTAILELYDTRLERKNDALPLRAVAESYADLPDIPAASAWYDDIRYDVSLQKRADAVQTPRVDSLVRDYLAAYLAVCAAAPACVRAEKMRAAAKYTEGLLTHGGPATDPFIRSAGRDFTCRFYRRCLFGTEE